MIARCVYLEGDFAPGKREEFEAFCVQEILPLMKRFPGVLSVRIMSALDIEDSGHALRISFESIYPSREAMDYAFTQPTRQELKKKLAEKLPLFKGRMFHITQQVLTDETVG